MFQCRLPTGVGSAVRALHMAPVETARAVQVTVGGTAAMLGEAAGKMAAAARLAAADSAQRLAASSRKAKVGCWCRRPGHACMCEISMPIHRPYSSRCTGASMHASALTCLPPMIPIHGSWLQRYCAVWAVQKERMG